MNWSIPGDKAFHLEQILYALRSFKIRTHTIAFLVVLANQILTFFYFSGGKRANLSFN